MFQLLDTSPNTEREGGRKERGGERGVNERERSRFISNIL